ncbi:hypothetical protein [Anabaena azotica]|uniref:Uncharacterized protein n=1 Tax=Anabaena azotica FACHB-119 TaxID=947527 RepID=A0ABR8D3N2_9NOST|nr:hypothetical protein [Anabaena azotica]MBD2501541.1 hypothetical protein [Anabaena azotica FACHB-119]
MNSRSGQASTLTKSRVAPSWQKSTFAIKPSFTIEAIQWPPPPPGPNPKPLPTPTPTPPPPPSAVPSNPEENTDPADPASI